LTRRELAWLLEWDAIEREQTETQRADDVPPPSPDASADERFAFVTGG